MSSASQLIWHTHPVDRKDIILCPPRSEACVVVWLEGEFFSGGVNKPTDQLYDEGLQDEWHIHGSRSE